MARVLGYRELPEEQHVLLRKVFDYVDTDGDGEITPAELKAVLERFGMRMPSAQLDMYVAEFDANCDGMINISEVLSIMSKLHGRMGLTTNPVRNHHATTSSTPPPSARHPNPTPSPTSSTGVGPPPRPRR